nr:MAG TPA: hypothetical protein [Caudoviricetes sp.]
MASWKQEAYFIYRSVCFYEQMPQNILMTHGRDHGRGDTIKHTKWR